MDDIHHLPEHSENLGSDSMWLDNSKSEGCGLKVAAETKEKGRGQLMIGLVRRVCENGFYLKK